MEQHADPAIRIGTSGVFAPNTRALPVPGFNPENTIVRLSDGTPLATRGALVPGATVDAFDFRLATVDAGWKWRGVSLNAEYYFRFLDGFTFAANDPPLPVPPAHAVSSIMVARATSAGASSRAPGRSTRARAPSPARSARGRSMVAGSTVTSTSRVRGG
jgi:hypothetical protein